MKIAPKNRDIVLKATYESTDFSLSDLKRSAVWLLYCKANHSLCV